CRCVIPWPDSATGTATRPSRSSCPRPRGVSARALGTRKGGCAAGAVRAPDARMRSGILACGAFLPPREVTNAELAPVLDTSPEVIATRTGIVRRYWAEHLIGPSDLACEAARAALATGGLEPAAVDLIVFATMTPDIAFPGAGVFLQDKLGC